MVYCLMPRRTEGAFLVKGIKQDWVGFLIGDVSASGLHNFIALTTYSTSGNAISFLQPKLPWDNTIKLFRDRINQLAILHRALGIGLDIGVDLWGKLLPLAAFEHPAEGFNIGVIELNHRRSARLHKALSLLSRARDTVAGDGLGLGELGFELTQEVAHQCRAEIPRTKAIDAIDHLDVEFAPTLLRREVDSTNRLPPFVHKGKVMKVGKSWVLRRISNKSL